jgi:Ca-activated chloride channel family protein
MKPGSDLDEKTLEEIAEMTDAQYFRAIDSEKLAEIYTVLDELEPIEYEEETYKPRTLLYHYPLAVALITAIVLSFILSSLSAFKQLSNKKEAHV